MTVSNTRCSTASGTQNSAGCPRRAVRCGCTCHSAPSVRLLRAPPRRTPGQLHVLPARWPSGASPDAEPTVTPAGRDTLRRATSRCRGTRAGDVGVPSAVQRPSGCGVRPSTMLPGSTPRHTLAAEAIPIPVINVDPIVSVPGVPLRPRNGRVRRGWAVDGGGDALADEQALTNTNSALKSVSGWRAATLVPSF